MEFFPHGDLEVYLSQKETLPEPEVEQIAFQVLEGLSSMHENGFAHRDLKPGVSYIFDLEIYAWQRKLTSTEHLDQSPRSYLVGQDRRLWQLQKSRGRRHCSQYIKRYSRLPSSRNPGAKRNDGS